MMEGCRATNGSCLWLRSLLSAQRWTDTFSHSTPCKILLWLALPLTPNSSSTVLFNPEAGQANPPHHRSLAFPQNWRRTLASPRPSQNRTPQGQPASCVSWRCKHQPRYPEWRWLRTQPSCSSGGCGAWTASDRSPGPATRRWPWQWWSPAGEEIARARPGFPRRWPRNRWQGECEFLSQAVRCSHPIENIGLQLPRRPDQSAQGCWR